MADLTARHEATTELLGFFTYAHLPLELQGISRACSELALAMVQGLPDSRELTVGLRKLLEAKDAFVRARLVAQWKGGGEWPHA